MQIHMKLNEKLQTQKIKRMQIELIAQLTFI